MIPQMTLPINSEVLRKIVDYCTYYQTDPMREIPKPLKSSSLSDLVQQWYADLVAVESTDLYELITAANYLDIKPLLTLTCSAIAALIRGKTPAEIRAVFGLGNDFGRIEQQSSCVSAMILIAVSKFQYVTLILYI